MDNDAGNLRSKLVRISVRNIGCIGDEPVTIALDRVVCLVGKNNAGKSTILRAYELAKGTINFNAAFDRNHNCKDENFCEIILDVHIPDGIGNIGVEWKIDEKGLKIVRSRWQWAAPGFEKVRSTWNPAGGEDGKGDWDPDKNAAGLDNVFSARLPRPIRIGSLDDAAKTEENLLALALSPFLSKLELERQDQLSQLANAIASVSGTINALTEEHLNEFNAIAEDVTKGFSSVFPSLGVKLQIGSAPLAPKIEELVKRGSGLKVTDGAALTSLSQQGTGARRALFWAMLQVHNQLSRAKEIREEFKKQLDKKIVEEKKRKIKKDDAEQIAAQQEQLKNLEAQLAAHLAGAPIPDSPEDPALPGYLLLIDEPENALHPLAARAAQRHLYKLGSDPDWQVLMTTHSPYFVNPFEDHTTIVRLERTEGNHGACADPKTYVSDEVEFVGNEKVRLQALQHIDPSLSEVFFGSYPILVEGDTEHAAFIASIIEKNNDLQDQITIVRARGKAILVPLIKVFKHFKLSFGIVHDCDPPYKVDGTNNGMWTENGKIRSAIQACREQGLVVRHRVSMPDFERFLGAEEASKDKPLGAYEIIRDDRETAAKVEALLKELIGGEQFEPFGDERLVPGVDYLSLLKIDVLKWASDNNVDQDVRFAGKSKTPVSDIS